MDLTISSNSMEVEETSFRIVSVESLEETSRSSALMTNSSVPRGEHSLSYCSSLNSQLLSPKNKNWATVSNTLRELATKIIKLGLMEIDALSPMDFTAIFFTASNLPRREIMLAKLLQLIYDGAEFWAADAKSPGELLIVKIARACKRWGIEESLDLIRGRGTPTENLHLWQKIIRTIEWLGKDKEKAKLLLDCQFPVNESALTWNQVTDSAVVRMSPIHHSNMLHMERLIDNKILEPGTLDNMLEGVKASMSENSHEAEDCDEKSHERCESLLRKGRYFKEHVESKKKSTFST